MPNNPQAPPLSKLMSATAVRELFGGISQMTLWRWQRAGVLPPPIQIRKRNFWPQETIATIYAKFSAESEA